MLLSHAMLYIRNALQFDELVGMGAVCEKGSMHRAIITTIPSSCIEGEIIGSGEQHTLHARF